VPGEKDPDSGPASRLENPPHPPGHLPAVGELADDADLHVIDDQGHATASQASARLSGT